MKVKDYLVQENAYKEYMLKLKTGELVWSYIAHDLPTEPLEFFKSRGWNADSYSLNEIEEVVKELPEEFSNECNKCFDGKVDVVKAMNGVRTCDDCLIQEAKLDFYKTNQDGVYKYENHDQLQKLYDILDNPISCNFNTDFGTHKIDTKALKHPFGLVHTWSHMDDFSDYPLDYCAIIDGVYIENIKEKHNATNH